MGGPGSGGRRVGAGAKPKDATLGALSGSRRTRVRGQKQNQKNQNVPVGDVASASEQAAPPTTTAVPIPPPASLTLESLAVWQELAPLAFQEGTLSESTALALRDLCEAIVLKRKLLQQAEDEGYVVAAGDGVKAHPLLSQFRGLMQRVEAGLTRFKLAPLGKELPPQEAPKDPFDEFYEPAASTPGPTTH